jgi:putative transposase
MRIIVWFMRKCCAQGRHCVFLIAFAGELSAEGFGVGAGEQLKGVSSRMIRQKRNSNMVKKLCALWSPSYFGGSCGGAPIAVIRQYIEKHSNHRKTQCQDGFAVRALDPALNGP